MSDTVSCQSCGRGMAPSDKFCPGCGTANAGAAATMAGQPTPDLGSNPTQCVKCATPMGRDDQFCPKCGTERMEAATVVSHVSLRNSQAAHLIEATQGEFEVLQTLGTGAMGAVYLAKDVALGRQVAIKVIAPNLLSDETMISRFRLEAQTIASLRHPNIVNIHGVRQSDDLHYFVMEFIDGPSLRSVVKTNAPLEVDIVRTLLFQVGSALSYAHRTGGGVIHRDIKPANIMLDKEGQAFVTDFGISKISEAKTGLTQTGATIGTPEYMSPEQCRGEDLGGASDQYALGIVGYEMLTGRTPFSGTQYHIMVAHTSEDPAPIRKLRPDCPADIAEAVERMLAKSPEARWPDLDKAVAAMGGRPLGYDDPTRLRLKALTGATLASIPTVGTGSPSAVKDTGSGSLDTATSVTVTGLPSMLETGERFKLQAEVKGAGDAALAAEGVEWASADPSIAKVEDGFVEALRPGSVSITAAAGNVASSVLLTVSEPKPAQVIVRPSTVNMQRGGRIGLKAEVRSRQGRELDDVPQIEWSSSDVAIATVNGGDVVAKGGGTATINAKCANITGTAKIIVEAAVGAEPAKAAATVAVPTEELEEVAEPPAPKQAPTAPAKKPRPKPQRRPVGAPSKAKTPAWRRGAVVVPLLIVAVAGVVGVQMFGSDGGTVTPPPAAPVGGDPATPQGDPVTPAADPVVSTLTVTQEGSGAPAEAGVQLAFGGTLALSALVADQNGDPMVGDVTWSTADASVAEVDGNGVIRAVSRGDTEVVANVESVTVRIPVSVTVPASAVAILGNDGQPITSLSLDEGQETVLGARVTGADGNAVERAVSWVSSDPGVVSIHPLNGTLTASRGGSASVVASVGGVSATLPIRVVAQQVEDPEPEPPAPVDNSPVSLQINVGPTFATLFIDNVRMSDPGRLMQVNLRPGTYQMRLEREGWRTHEQTLVVQPGGSPPPITITLVQDE